MLSSILKDDLKIITWGFVSIKAIKNTVIKPNSRNPKSKTENEKKKVKERKRFFFETPNAKTNNEIEKRERESLQDYRSVLDTSNIKISYFSI